MVPRKLCHAMIVNSFMQDWLFFTTITDKILQNSLRPKTSLHFSSTKWSWHQNNSLNVDPVEYSRMLKKVHIHLFLSNNYNYMHISPTSYHHQYPRYDYNIWVVMVPNYAYFIVMAMDFVVSDYNLRYIHIYMIIQYISCVFGMDFDIGISTLNITFRTTKFEHMVRQIVHIMETKLDYA